MYEDVYGRLHWDRPAITITASARNPASGRFVHPEQDRGLSIREAALLQGFPGDYWFSGSLDERFRQIGVAVPPAFAFLSGLPCTRRIVGRTYEQRRRDAKRNPEARWRVILTNNTGSKSWSSGRVRVDELREPYAISSALQ